MDILQSVVSMLSLLQILRVVVQSSDISYDPGELLSKIFNTNGTTSRQGYGLIKVHDGINDEYDQNLIKFDDQVRDINDNFLGHNSNMIKFQNDNNIEGQGFNQQMKRRVRRRRRKQFPYQGHLGPVQPGLPAVLGHELNPYFDPGSHYRPPPHLPPSIASEALSAITGALTSIALYDDYQCVPRLLCEAAGGSSGSSGFLQSVAGLEPLLTLLSAYSGVSASPLFVFGRAVLLGVTSKNTATCRYAYPQCPTDPEELIYYLNNHNGGFFRFFNNPNPQFGHQNLQQFYNQLSVPGNPNSGFSNPGVPNSNFGSPDPNFGYPNQQKYGFYNGLSNQGFDTQAGYGLYNGHRLPNGLGNYGGGYRYLNYGYSNQDKYKGRIGNNGRIEKRIQNKPNVLLTDNNHNIEDTDKTKFSFPEDSDFDNYDNRINVRDSRTLKFPEDNDNYYNSINIVSYNDNKRKGKGFTFPESHSNRKYIEYYNYPPLTPVYNHINNYNYGQNNAKNNDEMAQIIYVVRGNGDPNNPEVIKLRPGEKLT